jgi:hypothetical protein
MANQAKKDLAVLIHVVSKLLKHDFAEECQECAIGNSKEWKRLKKLIELLTKGDSLGS